VNDLYKDNYKPLKKEIEEDNRKWKYLPCAWISRNSVVKIAILDGLPPQVHLGSWATF
jgi:hypothetical protein